MRTMYLLAKVMLVMACGNDYRDSAGEVGGDSGTKGSPSGKVVGDGKTFDLPGSATMAFVWIEPGTFTMGSPSSEVGSDGDEGPQHKVTISQGFWLGKYEITQGQWEAVMGDRPWLGEIRVQENPEHPAVHVSWDDLQRFVERLNEATGQELYRLPTEAESEYACRAGTTTRWSFGDDEGQLREHAWYWDNAWDAGLGYGQPVGTKLANPWGLHDMHGNVDEWVQDRLGPYTSASQVDPLGPPRGPMRALQGSGHFAGIAEDTRSANRNGLSPRQSNANIGARLLRIR